MIKLAWTVALVASCIAGCAAPPFKATWYLVSDANDSRMLVAILNQTGQDQDISRIGFNPTPKVANGAWEWLAPGDGDPSYLTLQSGQLLVISQEDITQGEGNDKGWGKCRVPVQVLIKTRSQDYRPIQIIGSMPSAIPGDWLNCPRPPTLER